MLDFNSQLDELLVENLRRRQQRNRFRVLVASTAFITAALNVFLAGLLVVLEPDAVFGRLPVAWLAVAAGAALAGWGLIALLAHWFAASRRSYRELNDEVNAKLESQVGASHSFLGADPISFVQAWNEFEHSATKALDRRGAKFERLSVASLIGSLGKSGIVEDEDVERLRLMLGLRNAIVHDAHQSLPPAAADYLEGVRARLAA